MNRTGSRVLVFSLGLLASFLIAEVSLRVIGIFYSCRPKPQPTVERKPGEAVILCLGDSFTWGMGAPKGRGYPEQLEELLRKKYPHERIKVINKGVATYNSAEVLEVFNENADVLRPDLILLLAGGSNVWNVYGYSKRFCREGWRERLEDFFFGSKVFRLFRLMRLDYLGKRERGLFKPLSHAVTRNLPAEAAEAGEKGRKFFDEGRLEEAIYWFHKQIEIDPAGLEGYQNLRDAYSETRNYDGMRQVNKELLKRDPFDRDTLRKIGPTVRDPRQDASDIQFLKQYSNIFPIADDILSSKKNWNKYMKNLVPWVKQDLQEIFQGAKKKGINVFLQTYPNYQSSNPKHFLTQINFIFRELARDNGIPLIDHELIFNRIFLAGVSRDDYFEPAKVHCNERGYRAMATNIYCGMAANSELVPFFYVDAGQQKKCLEIPREMISVPRGVK